MKNSLRIFKPEEYSSFTILAPNSEPHTLDFSFNSSEFQQGVGMGNVHM